MRLALCFLAVPLLCAQTGAPQPLRYCNPLPLPEYPLQTRGGRDMRSAADPTVIRVKDKWYMYPSNGMAWWSTDMVNWHYQEMTLPGVGDAVIWAPTVMEHNGAFYLTANDIGLYRANDPLGPWQPMGNIVDENGRRFVPFDPMLYRDDDGRVYLYWSGREGRGIFGVELDPADLTKFKGPRTHLFKYEPSHVWERYGDLNEVSSTTWIEGPWVTKHNGRYYLQYSAPGTEWKTYAVGVYTSDKPLGPYKYDPRSPILVDRKGLLNGSAHHSVVEGPNGTYWVFYHVLYRIRERFERRIAMDPVGFDAAGNMIMNGPTETPQWAPGVKARPWEDNGSGSMPLTVNKFTFKASSSAPGRDPEYAIDNYVRTWWEAAPGDAQPSLEVDLIQEYTIDSARILWSDNGLDFARGIKPGPYQYRIEASRDGREFTAVLDRTQNKEDLNIAFDEIPPVRARFVRLVITGGPPRVPIGVVEFTVFGKE